LRYAAELRRAADYFADIKPAKVDAESLALAKELIQRKTAKFKAEKFSDEYESALRELIEAKRKHLPLPAEEKPERRAKVVNLMDALRHSLSSPEAKKPSAQAARGQAKGRAGGKGLMLVEPRKKGAEKRRKSA
jgi:DNA end-binding protein Ku